MLRDISWSDNRSYRTGSKFEPIQFYMDCLCNSKSFDLLLGYFSSAAISVLSLGFAKFLHSGGTLRVVVNNVLSSKDRDAIIKGNESINLNTPLDLNDIRDLRSKLDDYGIHFFECIAYLISNRRIQIKVIQPKNKQGISHYKNGIFYDEENYVGFSASCNFTPFGLLENLERLEAFLSWDNNRSTKFTEGIKHDFEKIFFDKDETVRHLNANEICCGISAEFGEKTIDELLFQEKELIDKKRRILENVFIKKSFDKAEELIESIADEPHFPYESGPRDYQKEAYNNWVNNGYKGIFAMATGTGKTITSLNCLLNEYHKEESYKAIIIVPTIALLQQWKKECLRFNFKNIITVNSKEDWNESLAFYATASKIISASFIVIITYASFGKKKFQSHFKLFPKEALLIADEVHNLGARGTRKLLSRIHLEKRIGLSATPHRKFDEEGNDAIEEFFNDQSPYIVTYSMKMALDSGWLCPYTYYPHIVKLNEIELEEYFKISLQLLKYFDQITGNYKKCDLVDSLLLKRKRIIHKATNKIVVFKGIMESEFKRKGNFSYTLIYVPEGLEPDYSKIDIDEETEDDLKLINIYTRAVRSIHDSIMIQQYTYDSKNREEILKDFESGKIHVLTSMKCLDEGIDVPRSELAIFCASTGNPRQFIQRRGRVLRPHEDKTHAVIHDLVVAPEFSYNEAIYKMERNIVIKELERVVDFSNLALNKTDSFIALSDLLEHYKLNLNDF